MSEISGFSLTHRARASETESEDLARKYFRIWQKKTFVSRRNQHALQRFREEKQRRMKRKILLAWHSWAFHDKASRARAEAEDFKQKFETLNVRELCFSVCLSFLSLGVCHIVFRESSVTRLLFFPPLRDTGCP